MAFTVPLAYPAPYATVPTVTYAFAPSLINYYSYYTYTVPSGNFVHAYTLPYGWTLALPDAATPKAEKADPDNTIDDKSKSK